jgi:trimethylamine--corrinoid protein Co-methyltransferase
MTVEKTLQRPPIEPLKRAFTLRFHTPAQLDRIKQATLDILETVGVRFPSAKALDILAGHGCPVDRERQVVTFPPDVVLAAMATAPRYFDLGARDPSCAFSIADDTTYCTSDGCGVEIVDFDTGVKRPSTKADLARVTRLTDYLSSISFWWPTISAGDCAETAQLHELDAGWNNTVKHLQGMVNGAR